MHAERYLTMRLALPDKKYPDAGARTRFYDLLEARLGSVPGVESAAIVTHLPLRGSFDWKFEMEGQPPVEDDKKSSVSTIVASPGYFATMGVALVRGRAFTNTDGLPDKGAAIVNQRFAAKYF